MDDAAAELDAFYSFGRELISRGEVDSFDEVLEAWGGESNLGGANEAIREGLADIDAGRTRPLFEAISELRAKHGIERT